MAKKIPSPEKYCFDLILSWKTKFKNSDDVYSLMCSEDLGLRYAYKYELRKFIVRKSDFQSIARTIFEKLPKDRKIK